MATNPTKGQAMTKIGRTNFQTLDELRRAADELKQSNPDLADFCVPADFEEASHWYFCQIATIELRNGTAWTATLESDDGKVVNAENDGNGGINRYSAEDRSHYEAFLASAKVCYLNDEDYDACDKFVAWLDMIDVFVWNFGTLL